MDPTPRQEPLGKTCVMTCSQVALNPLWLQGMSGQIIQLFTQTGGPSRFWVRKLPTCLAWAWCPHMWHRWEREQCVSRGKFFRIRAEGYQTVKRQEQGLGEQPICPLSWRGYPHWPLLFKWCLIWRQSSGADTAGVQAGWEVSTTEGAPRPCLPENKT